jgi:hypothetical protein
MNFLGKLAHAPLTCINLLGLCTMVIVRTAKRPPSCSISAASE